ncbi:MAG TPA: hypothetical protein VMD30_11755 [Tepidisphaeraceae bacterium]|nr:hypothetical protein [Tepidisphaeraceae bacterium]
MVIAWPIVGLMLLVLGGRLLYVGRKRWIGTEPHCRQCDYLLHGIDSERCPECGSYLSQATIVHGEARRKWNAFVAGWLILMALLAGVGVVGSGQLQQIDWYHYLPTYFVMRDLNSAAPATVQRAWTELTRREKAGSLSVGNRQELIAYALMKQRSAPLPVTSLAQAAIDFLGQEYASGNLTASEQAQFGRQCVRIQLKVRKEVVAGDFVQYQLKEDAVAPDKGSIWFALTEMKTVVDGKTRQEVGGGLRGMGTGGGSVGGGIEFKPPGKHVLGEIWHVEILDGPFDRLSDKLIWQSDETQTVPFEILAKAPPGLIQPISDPKLAAGMRGAIQQVRLWRAPGNGPNWVGGQLDVSGLPANLACDLMARFDGQEVEICTVTCGAHLGQWDIGSNGETKVHLPDTVDVILRPSEKAARETVDMFSYWDREIVLPHIAVMPKQ